MNKHSAQDSTQNTKISNSRGKKLSVEIKPQLNIIKEDREQI